MSFTLTSVNVDTIPENGGHLIELTGAFELGNPYVVYIGQAETTADFPCHSGKTDQGNTVYPYTATLIKCYTPIVDPGILYSITVQNTLTLEIKTLSQVLTSIQRQYQLTVFSIKKLLPHFYMVGPRDINQV